MIKIKDILDNMRDYANLRIELAELKLTDKSSSIASSMISGAILFFVLFIFLLVATVCAALLIGKYMNELYLGFLIMAVFYLVLGIILYTKRNDWIKKPFQNLLVKQIAHEN